jgi:hypothetical protein
MGHNFNRQDRYIDDMMTHFQKALELVIARPTGGVEDAFRSSLIEVHTTLSEYKAAFHHLSRYVDSSRLVFEFEFEFLV